jgi:hypothetical protein
MAAAVLNTTLEESLLEVASIRRLTVTERGPDMEGLDWHWKSVGSGPADLPQHEEGCGREALLV